MRTVEIKMEGSSKSTDRQFGEINHVIQIGDSQTDSPNDHINPFHFPSSPQLSSHTVLGFNSHGSAVCVISSQILQPQHSPDNPQCLLDSLFDRCSTPCNERVNDNLPNGNITVTVICSKTLSDHGLMYVSSAIVKQQNIQATVELHPKVHRSTKVSVETRPKECSKSRAIPLQDPIQEQFEHYLETATG